jgi:hypothetical protein
MVTAGPVAKFYDPGDRLYMQAQRIWLILVGYVIWRREFTPELPPLITYGALAEQMGIDPRAGHTLGRQFGIVADFCVRNGLPALNAIVVTRGTREPGDGVVYTPENTLSEEQRAVADFDWFKVRPLTTGTLRQVWEDISAAAA